MLGELIYEQRGKISGYRVLDTEGPTVETTISGTGIMKGVDVTDIVTYWSRPSESDRNVFYAEGQGIILSKEGEMASWKGYGIGHYNNRSRADRGSVILSSKSEGKLSFINNTIGVFEYEADENGNTVGKIWEWK
jgi:hypothetical protein